MKTIVNGHGKINKDGKYEANRKDQLETMNLIKVMEKKVKTIIAKKFGLVNKLKPTRYWALLQHVTAYLFTPSISVSGANFLTNRQASVFVTTGHNSSGYNDTEFKRFFTISFELKGKFRYKYQKRWEDDSTLIKKYVLTDNMEDAIAEFEQWINHEYDKFFAVRVLQNLSWRESQ